MGINPKVEIGRGKSFPSGPNEGDLFYHEDDDQWYFRGSSSWIAFPTFMSPEGIEDLVANLLSAGPGLKKTYDDPGDNLILEMDHLGLEDLTDPDADRIVFWDDSDSKLEFLIPNTNLAINSNNLDLSITEKLFGNLPYCIASGETWTIPDNSEVSFFQDNDLPLQGQGTIEGQGELIIGLKLGVDIDLVGNDIENIGLLDGISPFPFFMGG